MISLNVTQIPSKISTLLKKFEQKDREFFDKYQKMDDAGAADAVSSDYMDNIREVYDKADERTKEAMLKSYYQSKGQVISSAWNQSD